MSSGPKVEPEKTPGKNLNYRDVSLDAYERDNLLAALLAIAGYPGTSPMVAANTGDWVMQVVGKLGWNRELAHTLGRPNRSCDDIAEAARASSLQPVEPDKEKVFVGEGCEFITCNACHGTGICNNPEYIGTEKYEALDNGLEPLKGEAQGIEDDDSTSDDTTGPCACVCHVSSVVPRPDKTLREKRRARLAQHWSGNSDGWYDVALDALERLDREYFDSNYGELRDYLEELQDRLNAGSGMVVTKEIAELSRLLFGDN